MANKKIRQWVFPKPDEMHTVERWYSDEQGGLCGMLLRDCLHGVDEKGNVIKILYCSRDGRFFVRKNDGWRELKPWDSHLRRKLAGKPMPAGQGGNTDCPQIRYFGNQFCHKLIAFAWCGRLHSVNVKGVMHKCTMDYERGRMYYWDVLLDAQGNVVRKENGEVTFIKVYLQIDHLNTNHADYCADNLEYITQRENYRRRDVGYKLRKAGLDVKKMPYKLLRNLYKNDGKPEKRIVCVKHLYGDMFNLDKNAKQ